MAPGYRYPFPPFPNGWFCIAESADLTRDEPKALFFFGRDLAAYRGADGQAIVVDAHCPHLGAHLGHGGKISGDCISCPFHAWKYDGKSGDLVDVPYAKRLPVARLRTYPVIEWAGLVIVFYDSKAEAPTWTPELPEMPPDEWRVYGRKTYKVRVHVQDVGENGFDTAHIAVVHKDLIPELVKAEGKGPVFRVETKPAPDAPSAKFIQAINRTLWGLGLSMNYFYGKVESRIAITRTPIDEEYTEIRLNFIPKVYENIAVTEALGQALSQRVSEEIEQDMPIWENKSYIENPILAQGDGPVGSWRRWCKQFYPASISAKSADSQESASPAEA
ncbi:MAG: Rieske 2Fe-2S domain-containing protein [Polyangiaceae bacterium]|nr:Rieske 2Fe-2S domain-containing protein [Polyangiaceae bacterium]